MNQLSLPAILRILAHGINPISGHTLPNTICVHNKTYQTYLNRLANELENLDNPPAKRNHPKRWFDDELENLSIEWVNTELPLDKIAELHQRSELAIALKLITSGIAEQHEVLPHLSKDDQRLAEESLNKRSKIETK